MTLKNVIGVVVILVIALLIFSYIVNPTVRYKITNVFSEVKSDIGSNIKEIPSTKKVEIPIIKGISCEEKAKELFPENITVKYRFLEDISPSSDYTGQYGKWKDGSSFSGNSHEFIFLREGKNKGENINYYYMTYPDRAFFRYYKKIINEEGIVLGSNEFTVNFVLKPIPNSKRKLDGVYTLEDCEIIEYEFVSCNWVE